MYSSLISNFVNNIITIYNMKPSWQRKTNIDVSRVVNDPLAEIYNESQWRFNKVSPLHSLSYNTLKLKQYSSKIRQSVASSVAGNSGSKYSTNIVPQPGLKYSEEDSDGLKITVSYTNGQQTKVAYVCLLLSWGVGNISNEVVCLPYLIERGEQRIGTSVKSTLQSVFDCNIKPYFFTQHHLLLLGFTCLDYDTSRPNDPFTLVYRTSVGEIKDKLTLQFDLSDMVMIWNGVKDEVEDSSKFATAMYQMLKEQILHTFDLNISELELYEVNLPKSEFKNTGIIKMKTAETVNCVFSVLNEINNINLKI